MKRKKGPAGAEETRVRFELEDDTNIPRHAARRVIAFTFKDELPAVHHISARFSSTEANELCQ